MADPQATLPTQMTVRVLCNKGHLLTGLFAIFRLKPRTDGQKWADVARIVGVPGPAPAEPGPHARPKDRKVYEAARSAYDRRVLSSQELAPDPSTHFVAGFVDNDGYLVPVQRDTNPWLVAYTRDDPDSYKLALDEVYEVCLLRHPDPELARAVARHLNGAAVRSDAKYEIASFHPLTQDVPVVTDPPLSGVQLLWKLSEDASDYVPKGPARYGGWTIYLDMPHAMCKGVSDQVAKLQEDLGQLRYATGQIEPFRVRAKDGTPSVRNEFRSVLLSARIRLANALRGKSNAETQAARREMAPTIHYVQNQIAAAIGGFQEHVIAKRAFVLSHEDALVPGTGLNPTEHRKRSWLFALGAARTSWPPDDAAVIAPRASSYRGAVDPWTAERIEHWIARGMRKPGAVYAVMHELSRGNTWMIEHAAIAVNAWALLLRSVFGVEYGLGAGAVYRWLVEDPWESASRLNTHHTGTALDLSLRPGDYRYPYHEIPLRYEAHWTRPLQSKITRTPTDEERAVIARSKLDHDLRWRLYAHSNLDVFGGTDAIARVKENLARFVDTQHEEGIFQRFKARAFEGANGEADAYLRQNLARAIAFANELRSLSAAELERQYFRREVHQFIVNPYEADGGTAGPAMGPRETPPGHPPSPPWAMSYVNITALAYGVGLERIGAHQLKVRDQEYVETVIKGGKDKRATQKHTVRRRFSMGEFFSPKHELVTRLVDMTAAPSRSVQNEHAFRGVAIYSNAGREAALLKVIEADDIDRDFVRPWHEFGAAQPPRFRPSKTSIAKGAQIALVLGAGRGKHTVADSKKSLESALARFESDFATKRFVIVHAGEMFKLFLRPNEVVLGSMLAHRARAAQQLVESMIANRTTPLPPREANEPEQTRRKLEQRQRAEVARALPAIERDFTLVIQPVLLHLSAREPIDPTNVLFAPEHAIEFPSQLTPGHLEWWHHQYFHADATGKRSQSRAWREDLVENGLSLAVLGTPREGSPNPEPRVHRGGGFEKELDGSSQSNNSDIDNTWVEEPHEAEEPSLSGEI
jgi:hypothetical protein